MKVNIFFLVIFISNVFVISSNYTYEIIEELIPKTITFNSQNPNIFKIYKYIPFCQKTSQNKKDIYYQSLEYGYYYLYIYDDFNKIAQDSEFNFINYIKYIYLLNRVESILISDLDCKKEYFFIIKPHIYENRYYKFQISFGLRLNIIDGNSDNINLSPELSDIFSFIQRNETKKEIIFYSHNETKHGLIYIGKFSTIQILKNGEVIYVKEKNEYNKNQI